MKINAPKARNVGMVGMAGALLVMAAGVAAETFDATVQVQNALTVTQVQPMNFGTLFATTADDNTAVTGYSYLTLQPNGGFDDANEQQATGLPLLSLGGAQAARGSVAVGSTAAFQLTLPDAITTDLGDGTNPVTIAGTPVQLRIGGASGDPAVARFYLADFTAGSPTGGTVGTPTANVYPITPSFGSTAVSFGIGAVILTDLNLGGTTRTTYEAGTYEGTFEVTASY